MLPRHDFSVGIEEEFFLVDAKTFDCVDAMPETFWREAKSALGDQVKREIIASMIEINSSVHASVPAAISEVSELRELLAGIAQRHSLAIIAAGTHPFADWREQQLTQKARYAAVAESLQTLAKRCHICGLHVHVGVADSETRIDLMNRVQRFLPVFLALSTSSPFWRAEPSGLKSYRFASNGQSPRSGLPGWFASANEFDRYVAKLVAAKFIPDASYLWWAIRPSSRFPTLELRIADSCTRVGDTAAITSLYQSLLHHLAYNPASFREHEHHHLLINQENLWQAVRHGIDARFVDSITGEITTVACWVHDLTRLVTPSARELGCLQELLSVSNIISEGSSADEQLRNFEDAILCGATHQTATRRVAGELAHLTVPATATWYCDVAGRVTTSAPDARHSVLVAQVVC